MHESGWHSYCRNKRKLKNMKLLTTLLVGAAVAGVIYYIVDREGAEELLGDVKDAAQDAYDKMNEGLAGVKSKVSETLG